MATIKITTTPTISEVIARAKLLHQQGVSLEKAVRRATKGMTIKIAYVEKPKRP